MYISGSHFCILSRKTHKLIPGGDVMSSGFDDFGQNIDSIVREAVNSGNFENLGRSITHAYTSNVQTKKREKPVPFNVLYKPAKTVRTVFFVKIVFACLFLRGAFVAASDVSAYVILLAITVFLFFRLWKERNLIKRYTAFVFFMQQRTDPTFIDIQTLSNLTGKSKKAVLKDAQKFIRKCWIKQGHLDRTGSTLIASNKTYRLYLESEKERYRREQESILNTAYSSASTPKTPPAAKDKKRLSPETEALLKSGEDYICKLQALNDAIPDADVSEKISQIENVTRAIFSAVKSDPAQAKNLRRFMNYYLPTTIKLLDAYDALDDQAAETANIRQTKQDIEDALDRLNVAFRQIFDDMFEDTSMDIASDIDVLNNCLARDGYTKSPFDNTDKH